MPRRNPSVLLAVALLLAPVAPAADDKPTPAAKARQLLDASIETLSSASAPVQLAAILQIIDLYRDLDRAKTLELIDQGMMIAGG